jgi:type II secretory pathway component PulJ
MDWSLDLNTLITLLSVASIAGMGWQSLKQLRRDFERLEGEVRDFRELKADIAVIKNQLFVLSEELKK